MSVPNTPSASNAEGYAYTGHTYNTPGSTNYTVHDPDRVDPEFFYMKVQNEILRLIKSGVVSPGYQISYTCGAGDAVGDPVRISSATTVTKALATSEAGSRVFGFISYKPTTTTCYIDHFYNKTGLSGLTVGEPVYLSDTGTVTAAPGTYKRPIGIAYSTTAAILSAAADQTQHEPSTRALAQANLLINPGFDIWQRGTSSVALGDGTYTGPDRWYGLIQGSGVTAQRTTTPTGFTARYACRLTSGGTTNRGGIATVLEANRSIPMRSNRVTLQFKCRANKNAGSGSIDVRYAILEWTSTADTVTKDVVSDWTSSTYTSSNFFVASTNVTVTNVGVTTVSHNTTSTISLTGTFGASVNNIIVFIWLEDVPAHASDYIDISEVVLVPGYVVPGYWNPREIQQEVQLCQRYYEKSYNIDTTPGTATSNGLNSIITRAAGATNAIESQTFFKVQKRTNPTVTLYDDSTNANKVTYSGVGNNQTGTVLRAGEWGFLVDSDGATAGKTGMFYHFTADAEL